jgi:mycothione reductase
MQHFDLVIIGTGSGNSILTPEFEDWDVAIVERGVFGGTCLNAGCIPSKMLVLPADRMVEASEATERLDVDIQARSADWPALRDRIFGRIDPIAAGGTEYRHSQDHVTVFHGDGRFVGDHRLAVTAADGTVTEITAERFVLAAGARPRVPEVPGLVDGPFHTSDTIMRIEALPEHLIIMGGGFIAAELGHVFSALGSKVSVVHRGDRMLRHEDAEVSARFTRSFSERVDTYFHAEVVEVLHLDDGRVRVLVDQQPEAVQLPGHRRCTELEGDALLVTTGRDPNGDQLGVTATGVELDEDGYVVTDPQLRTGVPGIWALGDIRNPLQLKHLANQEQRVVTHNLLHPHDLVSVDQRVVPHAVFSHPQIGSVGLTEMQLRSRDQLFVVGRCDYAGVAYGWALEDRTGFAKILVDAADATILGAHVIGPQAATLVQQVAQAMQFGITADRLAREQIWCHPALPELLENALLDAVSQLPPQAVAR